MASGELLNHARDNPVAAVEAAQGMAQAIARMAERHYDRQRHRFDYGAAAVSDEYQALRAGAAALAGIDPLELNDPETAKAFWINTYNALAIHIILASSIGASVRERDDFFTGPHYCIGGHEMTLDAIEHGILRGNARKYMGLKPAFTRDDRRIEWSLAKPDPRMHFALHMGAVSSPVLRAVPLDQPDATLERAARDYLDATVSATQGGHIELPRVFRWYTSDFGGSIDDALAFVRTRLDDDRAESLAREDIDAVFAAFDWRLNDRYAALD